METGMETKTDMETGMETKTDMETDMDMETETVTKNIRTWTWNWGPFAKYFMQHNSPYSASSWLKERHKNFCHHGALNNVFMELEKSVWG
jgi:hypothetical protein